MIIDAAIMIFNTMINIVGSIMIRIVDTMMDIVSTTIIFIEEIFTLNVLNLGVVAHKTKSLNNKDRCVLGIYSLL